MIHEPRTLHSLTMLSTWFNVNGIDNEINENNTDITIFDADLNPIQVRLSMDPIAEEPQDGLIILDAKAITGRDIIKAKTIFQNLVESLGYTYKDPTGRTDKKNKTYAKDDFENVYLRHNDLRRVPNPDTDRLLFYSRVVDIVCKSVYNKSTKFWVANQVDLDDLKSIAMTHVVSYIGNYEVPEHMDKENNNLRKCHSFLAQRLYFYKSMLKTKSKNCLKGIMADDSLYTVFKDEEEVVDKDYIKRHNVFSSKDKTVRRKEAKELLDKSLADMGHDNMIDTLKLAAGSSYIHVDAAKMAQRMLDEHYVVCNECLPKEGEKVSPMYVGGR